MSDTLRLLEPDEKMKPFIEHLAIGRDHDLEDQLIKKSQEPNILRFTPNDAKKRFGDRDMLEKWLSKGRTLHWLIGKDGDLAGIIWYGDSEFPADVELAEKPGQTFAIRIYDGYSGHGLARPFMTSSLKALVEDSQTAGEPVPGIWLQTDIDNPAAVAAYTKFGYEEVARDDKRVTMVLDSRKVSDIANSTT